MSLFSKGAKIYRTKGIVELVERAIRLVFMTILCFYYRNLSRPKDCADVPKIIRIEAQDIKYQSHLSMYKFPIRDSLGNQPLNGILGGPWDKLKTDWEQNDRHQLLKERFVEDKDWEDIDTFTLYEYDDEHLKFLDKLYDSMSRYGYIPQSEIKTVTAPDVPVTELKTRSVDGEKYPNECFVGIGRNGEIIRFTGANHRISIAKILDLDEIPVIVVIRHQHWHDIRSVFECAELIEEVPEPLQKFADHPDIEI